MENIETPEEEVVFKGDVTSKIPEAETKKFGAKDSGSDQKDSIAATEMKDDTIIARLYEHCKPFFMKDRDDDSLSLESIGKVLETFLPADLSGFPSFLSQQNLSSAICFADLAKLFHVYFASQRSDGPLFTALKENSELFTYVPFI